MYSKILHVLPLTIVTNKISLKSHGSHYLRESIIETIIGIVVKVLSRILALETKADATNMLNRGQEPVEWNEG